MAKASSDHGAASAPKDQPSKLGLLGRFVGWLKRHPVRGGLTMLAGVLMIGAAAAGASMLLPEKPKPPQAILEDALHHLDAGDFREARKLAAQLRTTPEHGHADAGGAMFVLGVAMARDAEQNLSPAERKTLNLIAARYLEESRMHGFPEGREHQGQLLLGRCLHDCGRFAAATVALRNLHASEPADVRLTHELLADSYLKLNPPRLDKARAENEQLLALSSLTDRERDAARLQQGQILFEQKNWDACREILSSIADSSPIYPEALLLNARVTLRQVTPAAAADDKNAKTDKPPAVDAETYTALVDQLRSLLARDGLSQSVIAQSQLLLGICQLGQADEAGALTQLSRVRRGFAGRPESLAAMLLEAELQQQSDAVAEALALYLRLLLESGPADTYHNPWLPLAELDSRISQAFDRFVTDKHFTEAVELATASGASLGDVRRCEMLARAHTAWAEQLQKTALDGGDQRAVIEVEAREHYREAAAQLEQLAALRMASRSYLDDLARSGRAYLLGNGFRQAARIYRKLLAQEPVQGRPEALTGLGESLLASGDAAGALHALNQCREMYPNHPATYRARLIASAALEEQGQVDAAKEMLADNLYRFSLTPQSSEWRDSLFDLGNLLYRDALLHEARSRVEGVDSEDLDRKKSALIDLEQAHKRFQEAIKTLSEAIQRYPEAPQVSAARYHIAESYRHGAKWPRKRMGIITVENTRVSLHRQMQSDLQSAVEAYSQIIGELGDEREAASGALEQGIVRNCYFARGDALFDLGQYEEAIKAYSAATNRFQHEPEALEAYVQIAACYRRLKKPAEARGTLEQARMVLARIRPDADFARTTHCNREQWNELLTWLVTL